MHTRTHWAAVLLAAVVGMFIGFLWYGLFFQDAWSEAVGFTGPGLTTPGQEVMKWGRAVELDPVLPMIINLTVLLLQAVLLSWLIGQSTLTSGGRGSLIGLVVGTCVALMSGIGNLFAMESFRLSLIDGTYYVVLFAAIGAIVGGWRKSGMA